MAASQNIDINPALCLNDDNDNLARRTFLTSRLGVGTMEEFMPKEQQFVSLIVSLHGTKSFTYINDIHAGKKEIFFINKITQRSSSEPTKLQGQFIFAFERIPYALKLAFCAEGGHEISFPFDQRISGFKALTQGQVMETKSRLIDLVEKTHQTDIISKLISKL